MPGRVSSEFIASAVVQILGPPLARARSKLPIAPYRSFENENKSGAGARNHTDLRAIFGPCAGRRFGHRDTDFLILFDKTVAATVIMVPDATRASQPDSNEGHGAYL